MEASPLQGVPDLPAHSQIGERLRTARQAKGMTVRGIAQLVGVSPSLISQIERDKVNPSVSTLWALVSTLGLTMGDVFPDEAGGLSSTQPTTLPAPSGPVTAPGTRSTINLETGVQWERLTAGSDPVVEFLMRRLSARSGFVRRGLADASQRQGIRLRAQWPPGVCVGFDEYELEPGMAISFDASSPHRLWAIGEKPAEAIWFVVGRQNDSSGHLTR